VRINQNPAAFSAYRNLTANTTLTNRTLERLSSGQQINRATDDAAGLVRSESLRTQVSSTIQATQNAQDGVSFLQTAEGALGEVQSMLQRMRVLAIDAANTSSTTGQPQQIEVQELIDEIEAIGARTTFGGTRVFQDFSTAPLVFQIGTGSAPGDRLEISDDLRTDPGVFAGGVLSTLDLVNDPDAAIAALDSALDQTSAIRGTLGAKTGRLEHAIDNLLVARENLSASESRIRDADIALEMVTLTSAQILSKSAISMLGQANTTPQAVLELLN